MRCTWIAILSIASVVAFSSSCAEAPAPFTGLPFIHDDYDAAVAEAQQRDVPVFVDAMAPWCHSCLSMKEFVLADAGLAPVADHFVWLELDMENPGNAGFREKFPVEAYPTYFIVDPRDERALIRWVGACSVERLLTLLDEAALAYAGETPERLARADALYAEGKNDEAVAAYQDVLDTADAGAPYYPRAVESMLFALYRAGDPERGLALAEEALPRLRRAMCAGQVAAAGLGFAVNLPEDAPNRQARLDAMESEARAIANDSELDLLPDDRSSIYLALIAARRAAGDEEGHNRVASEWATFLERAAAAAETPAERVVFDSHRVSAYLELGEPEKTLPFLEQSERDFPDDYNPPARLALAYRYLEEWDLGIAASERALAKPGTDGPRRLRILQNLARVHETSGDVEAARQTLLEAIKHGEGLSESQRPQNLMGALRKQLETL